VARDDGVAPGALALHLEVVRAVARERVELLEGAGIEQLVDALAGAQAAAVVLLALGLPLDATGRLDPIEWREGRARCTVRRFWAGEADRYGRLVHRAGGTGGATWLIDYDDRTFDDDEAGFQLGEHVFRAGEYVSIRDDEGHTHTFQVAAVRPIRSVQGSKVAQP